MSLKFSEIEIRALRSLCSSDASAGELAARLRVKKSFVSRVLTKLEEKGIILGEKRGTTKVIMLSPASHAQNFKRLSDSRPNVKMEEWLRGWAIDVLVIALEGVEIGLLQEEVSCSRATLYKVLGSLSAAGVIKRGWNFVRVSDSLVGAFANSFADNLQLLLQRKVKGLNNSIRVRKHIVLRTDAKEVPSFFSETGINALTKKGLEASLTSYRDFYFNLDREKRELSLEEYFIHALLLATLPHYAGIPLLGMFFAKNRSELDLRLLKKLAKTYSVENQLNELRLKTEFYEKMRSFE